MNADATATPVPADEPMHLFVGFRETGGEAFIGVKRTLDEAKALVEEDHDGLFVRDGDGHAQQVGVVKALYRGGEVLRRRRPGLVLHVEAEGTKAGVVDHGREGVAEWVTDDAR